MRFRFVVDLDAVPKAAADLQQSAGLDGQPGFLADLSGDGVLVPFALDGVAGGEAPLPSRGPEPVAEQQYLSVPVLTEPTSQQKQAFGLIGTPIPAVLRK
jgi:hypothetical protein